MTRTNRLLDLLGIDLPILQAPMAGVSTPHLAAEVSEAGALGALGLGASGVTAARSAVQQLQDLTNKPFNLNVFCHADPIRDPATEKSWIARAAPLFDRFASPPPTALDCIYDSFRHDDAMLEMLLDLRPAVVSFHFGLPRPDQMQRLKYAGLVMLATATSAQEARMVQDAGCHAVIAQGWEAGGHRGIFDPDAPDARLTTDRLLPQIIRAVDLPVVAAGGMMTGRDIARVMSSGAAGAQLGTAFVGCPESAADDAYRDRLALGGETVMTAAISGRPARCLDNAMTEWAADAAQDAIPAYPCAYDLAKAIARAASAKGATAYAAQWAGSSVDRSRVMPAAQLVETLAMELAQAL
ncbi:NAD(P)H-dependent flavin oxidoreductase [Paracoccus indicus]|uniref:NAD(P)H-dependent flavin oxidoreductase n=1 Tax=Paracoccus indicus TaxID=2079229 RepID=UPI000D37E2E2|nr:nitronate monooxygenase [Paracoccus indicus]